MLVVLGTISTYNVKESWERVDLVGVADNLIKIIEILGIENTLNGNLSRIEILIPPNVDFGLRVNGIPKKDIIVGCFELGWPDTSCGGLISILTRSVYLNNREINFNVVYLYKFSTPIPNYIDVMVFHECYGACEWNSTVRSWLEDYLNRGGSLIWINKTDGTDIDFNQFFGLTPSSGTESFLNFTKYEPEWDETMKYFLGAGFIVDISGGSPYSNIWYIWRNCGATCGSNFDYSRYITQLSPNTLNFTNFSANQGPNPLWFVVNEGEIFTLTGPDGNKYFFKLRKIWDNDKISIQPLNTSFIFLDNSGKSVVGNNILANSDQTYASATKKGSNIIWMGDSREFWDSTHDFLTKAAILSLTEKEWFLKKYKSRYENVEVSSFMSLCCDMPETVELSFILWYRAYLWYPGDKDAWTESLTGWSAGNPPTGNLDLSTDKKIGDYSINFTSTNNGFRTFFHFFDVSSINPDDYILKFWYKGNNTRWILADQYLNYEFEDNFCPMPGGVISGYTGEHKNWTLIEVDLSSLSANGAHDDTEGCNVNNDFYDIEGIIFQDWKFTWDFNLTTYLVDGLHFYDP